MALFVAIGVALLIFWMFKASVAGSANALQAREAERARESQAQQDARRTERAYELDHWYHDESDDFTSTTFAVDFQSMVLTEHSQSTDGPGLDERRAYTLRRNVSGVWESLHTSDSFRAELALDARIESMMDVEARARAARIREHAPQWEPMPVRIAPMIETAYQRHIHQSRQ